MSGVATLVVGALLALVIGAVLGMLGGGGSILMLPMLVFALGVEPRGAIATSLLVVGATALVAAAMHARAKLVNVRVAALFGTASMTGAFAAGRFAHFVPAGILLLGFGVIMLVTAIAMLRSPTEQAQRRIDVGRSLGLGFAVGAVAGLVGAGGGFLVVPALTFFGGLRMREAIGTSLAVIALQSFAGFAGHAASVSVDWTLAASVTTSAVIGAMAGASIGKRISAVGLRRGFAWLVLAMGVFVVARETPAIVTALVAAASLAGAVLVAQKRPRSTGEKRCTS
jgi:uncharacterized membrane protein YfcA